MKLSVIILAAGQGKRMRSDLPKVLQPLAGRPLLGHVLDTAEALGATDVHVVYGHGGEQVQGAFRDREVDWALQAEQLGTGHAVQQALPGVPDDHTVLILCGDVPLVRAELLKSVVSAGEQTLAVLTAELPDPTGYGRILRDGTGRVNGIVEERDATDDQRAVREINSGLMACPASLLGGWLGRVGADNTQGEYYLTDIVGLAVTDGRPVNAICAPVADEVLGINDRRQLAHAESLFRARVANALLDDGVTLVDPARIDVRGELICGHDVVIDINTLFIGAVELGDGVVIGPNAVIRDSVLGAGTRVLPHCLIEEATVGTDCEIGPYARLRPATVLAERAKIGNFVEIKKSEIGPGSKVNHLTYVGDATVGAAVNVGAGTITCNYDGANKHRTVIGDGAFIGSGVELVAPVEVGAGATIGAGSTISKSAPSDQLTLERSKQVTIKNWKRPVKE
ncbi:MAG: bifunctional UDP-N-acetylglucosamine diphosphorylase/glucosamine-1-phosphate N-acetyltransferase GlmU [Gammaproteobacteria bacterium]|nr:bifunctional UDP-N-acetylglucosamine diphosphorylase/glucosamine-1-phosphate N-acetyltransferase GlmU [Gammaproteobacteria bacterium]